MLGCWLELEADLNGTLLLPGGRVMVRPAWLSIAAARVSGRPAAGVPPDAGLPARPSPPLSVDVDVTSTLTLRDSAPVPRSRS